MSGVLPTRTDDVSTYIKVTADPNSVQSLYVLVLSLRQWVLFCHPAEMAKNRRLLVKRTQ